MKDSVLLLLCAVALAHAVSVSADANTRTCNCDPTEAAQICQSDVTAESLLIAHEYCNMFYKCANGKPVAYTCPGTLLYNPYEERCDWPETVDCGDRPIADGPIEDEDCDDDTGNDVGGGNDSTGDNEPGTCNCNPEEAPSICAAKGSDGTLIAHEKCNKFYQCDHNVPVAFKCNSGLLYNPYAEACDWAYNVDCGDRIIPDSEENVSIEDDRDPDDNLGNDDPGTCNCDPSEAPTICGTEGSNGVLVAHEDCDKFYMCNNGKPIAFNCSGNLLYNPYTTQCDWPYNVECGDRIIPEADCACNDQPGSGNENNDTDEDIDDDLGNDSPGNDGPDNGSPENDSPGNDSPGDDNEDNDSPGNDGPGNDSPGGDNEDNDSPDNDGPGSDNNDEGGNIGAGNDDPNQAPSICADDDSEGVLVAHENCNQFYICNGGKPVVLTCPSGLLFNPNTDQCDWPENVACGDRVIPEPDDNDVDDGNDGPGSDNDGGNVGGGNDDPSQAPSICAGDDSEGVLVAHENCNQFYICNGGTPVVLTCPSGLLFNPNTDQCDWPKNVNCGDRVIPEPDDDKDIDDDLDNDSPGNDNDNDGGNVGGGNNDPSQAPSICAGDDSEGVLVAHENCNQFYICNGGKPVVLTCPSGLLFNPATDQCDWPENVDCGDRVIPEPEDDNDVDDGNNGPGSDNDGGNVGGGNDDPSQAPSICAGDDSEGVLVAHENCNQFYICSGGSPVVLTCPSGLLFNPNTDQCDWPENVDCGDRVIPEPDDDKDIDDDLGNDSPGNDDDNDGGNVGGGNDDPSQAPSICAGDDSEGVLVAHENCNQFYICNGGKPVVLTCPSGLLFNPATDQCDWPENVDCGDRVIPEPEDDNDVDDGNNGPGSDNDGGNVGGGNDDPSQAPSICAGDDSDGVLVAHENCNQFYICNGGTPVVLTCPSGLLFNPNTDQCDWPENVGCGDRVIPEPDDDKDIDDDLGNDSPGNDNDNDGGNVGGGNDDPSQAPSICAGDDSEGVLVAHENCNQFYICNGGKPVVLTCPSGLLFNPATDQCDWPENVDCGDRVIPEPEDDNDVDDGNNGPGSDNDGGNVGGGNDDPSQAPSICAGDDLDGVLVAHKNCNQFYICNGGKPVVLTCPSGLLFNPNTDQCDWPENVDCGDRVIPEPDQDTDNNPGGGGDDNDNNTPGGGGNDNDNDDNDIDDNLGNDSPGNDGGNEDQDSNESSGDDCVENDPEDNDNGGSDGGNEGTCNCNPEEASNICNAAGSDGEFVAHENCNKFYQCFNGRPFEFSCAGNLLYNPYIERCDWPYNVDCGDRTISEPDEDNDDNNDNENDNENDGTCNCDPSEAPSICNATGSDGVLVAHENCNQFYMCSNGNPVALSCYGDLLYNPYTRRCDWPDAVECGGRVIPDPEEKDPDNNLPNDPEDNDNDNSVVDDPSQAPAICAESGSDGVLVAHENCDKFYMCNGGSPSAMSCPENLLFNTNTGQCDWAINVDCGSRLHPDDTCACNPRNAPALCAGPGSHGLHVAHEDCHQFYVCIGEVPIARQCPANLVYNIDKEVCDWQHNVDCGNRASTSALNKHLESRIALRY